MPHSPDASSLPPTTATAAPPPTAAASEPATASSTTPLLGQRLKLLRDGLLGGLGNDKEKENNHGGGERAKLSKNGRPQP